MNNTSTTNDSRISAEIEASAKVLTLPPGIYAFTVQGGPSAIRAEELSLPAMQVGLAPMRFSGAVEFLSSVGTLDRWLARSTDTIIARIFRDSASLLLTSVRLPGSAALAVNIQRLDVGVRPDSPELQTRGDILPSQILTHIKDFGDICFNDGWAGFPGQRLWIEAFAILAVDQLPADSIEYCGVTADGFQTPWLTNQMICGSRGRGKPITGYAVRLKPEFAGLYDCAYTGRFLSGSTKGPFRDGDLCCSDVVGDPLEEIELRITQRFAAEGDPPEQVRYSAAG